MKTLAEFAIRRRWFVVAGWIIFVIAVQAIAGAAGGAAYKDTFSLPGTETASVTNLLKGAGLSNQSGVSGTVVVKNKNGVPFAAEPAELTAGLAKLCTAGKHVALVVTPWQSINCSRNGATGPGNPKLLSRTHDTALAVITWGKHRLDPQPFKDGFHSPKPPP